MNSITNIIKPEHWASIPKVAGSIVVTKTWNDPQRSTTTHDDPTTTPQQPTTTPTTTHYDPTTTPQRPHNDPLQPHDPQRPHNEPQRPHNEPQRSISSQQSNNNILCPDHWPPSVLPQLFPL